MTIKFKKLREKRPATDTVTGKQSEYEKYTESCQTFMRALNAKLFDMLSEIPKEKIEKCFQKSTFRGRRCIVFDESVHRIMKGNLKRWMHWRFPKYFQIDLLNRDTLEAHFGSKWCGYVHILLTEHLFTNSAHITVIFARE